MEWSTDRWLLRFPNEFICEILDREDRSVAAVASLNKDRTRWLMHVYRDCEYVEMLDLTMRLHDLNTLIKFREDNADQ
jgi:hypothetical protein